MNVNFMRLVAERLEHVGRVEIVPEDRLVLAFFDSMDGFFMSSDLQIWDRPPSFIFGDDDYFIGSIEEWAVKLVQERHGYHNDYEHEEDNYENWVDGDIDDEFSERRVWLLACRVLGLGDETDGSAFIVDDDLWKFGNGCRRGQSVPTRLSWALGGGCFFFSQAFVDLLLPSRMRTTARHVVYYLVIRWKHTAQPSVTLSGSQKA